MEKSAEKEGKSRASKFACAPMMARTDRHFRYLVRLLCPDMMLYTEMVVAQAVLNGDTDRLLGFHPAEHPVALQLGGSDPGQLAAAAAAGARRGYDEINLNIGCPSDRVRSGRFGACLMADPQTVARAVASIGEQVNVPVSIKTRIGIDDRDDYPFLRDFVTACAEAGCGLFIVHARKAILAGLSPAENRTIPPLNYDRVYRLKQDFPGLRIVLNGGVRTTGEVADHLQHVDGVMIGRQAYADPYWLTELHRHLHPESGFAPSRTEILARMAAYAETEMARGVRLSHICRHLLGLFAGQPGARRWRRFVTEQARHPDARPDMLLESIEYLAPNTTTGRHADRIGSNHRLKEREHGSAE